MFHMLDDTIKQSQPGTWERLFQYMIVFVISVLVLGGLYLIFSYAN